MCPVSLRMLPRLDTFLATGVPKPTRVPCVCHCPCQPYTRSARRHTGCRHVSYRPHSGISLTLHEQILQSTLQNHSARTGRLCFPPVPNTQFHSLLSGRCILSGLGSSSIPLLVTFPRQENVLYRPCTTHYCPFSTQLHSRSHFSFPSRAGRCFFCVCVLLLLCSLLLLLSLPSITHPV